MLTYSTCQSCGELLKVIFYGQLTHPGCKQVDEELLARAYCDAIQRGDAKEAERLERELNKPVKLPALGPVALWYAKQGWPVFPLRSVDSPCRNNRRDKCAIVCQCPKSPATQHGLKDATTDLVQIKQWWTANPNYNIGLPTGIRFDVVDIDGPEGARSLAELGEDALPEVHGQVSTPRGAHFYVLPTGDGNRAGVRTGIDYRGVGGYVCAPPSRIGDKHYSWSIKPSPEIIGAQ